ncbi:multidrug ABC transporter ATP-binding protein [Candidatus Wirthbacteria bacterium CG2_30_54_11]|uniref:Multidrug ABC transporter ATP-binding protein n=1 Tax=Candidatus Wirthbacteria bacterium CG2_30_54_11 TaxID=1817892 RepID=A0A1J5IVZ4_9BACT|nr:MAG: multidrug ABC transporter ATP-binding protein [Candidatus Wirthbacteria bacterium CG2_30_54_11]
MLKLLKYLKPHRLNLAVIMVFVYIQVMADLQLPDYMARIVNQGIVLKDTNLILRTGTEMLAIALLGAACSVIVSYLASRLAAAFSMTVRHDLFARVESYSLAEFNHFSTASLITRSTNDIQQIQLVLLMVLRFVLSAPIMGVGAVLKAYHTAPSMTWIMGLAVTILLGTIVIIFSIALPRFQALQKLVDQLNLVTRQILTGLRVIRAFNREEQEAKNFEATNRELTSANLFVNRLMVIMQPFMMFIFNMTSLVIVWVGASMIDTGSLNIGDMMAFMQYSMQVIFAFLMVSMVFIMVPRASVSAGRIAEVLSVEPAIQNPKDPKKNDSKKHGEVEFKDVSFSYAGAPEPVLEHISFTAGPGQTTALIGSTGSGKSTLINLVPRFYDVTGGAVLVEGTDVRDMRLEDLYQKIGFVPQKGVLFSGTVESNIRYGAPDASDEQVKEAAITAQATEFIDTLTEKYQHPIAQGGTNVSGGQKQRLSIARAIARDPAIYIFDDSFSAVDMRTDVLLRGALKKKTKHSTVIIVAQRISTIVDADQIIVLDQGHIAGTGTHDELLKSCEVYQEIASSQLSANELKKTGKASHTQEVVK